jgi:cell division protease FtsH
MSDALGMVQLAPRQNPYVGNQVAFPGEKPFSEETARVIDAEVQRIIDESHQEAVRLLTAHRRELDALVAALLSKETLSEGESLQATGLPAAPVLEGRPLTAIAGAQAQLPVGKG